MKCASGGRSLGALQAARHERTDAGDGRDSEAGEVRCRAGSAGVAANSRHGSVFAVLACGLNHPSLPSDLHALSVVGVGVAIRDGRCGSAGAEGARHEVLAASHSEREALVGGREHLAATTAFTVAAIIMREVAAALEDELEAA
jgi:hypothetical protein